MSQPRRISVGAEKTTLEAIPVTMSGCLQHAQQYRETVAISICHRNGGPLESVSDASRPFVVGFAPVERRL